MTRPLMASLCMLALVACTNPQQSNSNPRLAPYSQQIRQALSNAQNKVITPLDETQATSVVLDPDGTHHVHFNRRYRGLRVIGGDFVVHSRGDGTLKGLTTSVTTDQLSALNINPDLSASAARQFAQNVTPLSGNATTELVILAHERAPTLAYEVISNDPSVPRELHLLVDARTGTLLDKWDGIETTAAIGSGYGLFVGPVSISTNTTSSGYEMRDVTRGNGFYTCDMNNGTTTCTIFTSTNNVWGNLTNAARDSAGVDAHYGQMMTYDYYWNVHGRNGIDGAGYAGYSRVHYASGYDNAYWDGTCMTYGDGDGTTWGSFVPLDIAGHEMTHGVTAHSAGLIYSGESGGLNEATSDIFGTMVEFYANSYREPPNYLIGEQAYTPGHSGDALRYMYNPAKDGASANCWSSTVGNLDVHYSSGVANHFFYLLVNGSSNSDGLPSSPTCNSSVVTGIGRFAAQKIYYRALTVYMNSSTNYAAARVACLNAATDLYGTGSTQYNAVAAAWSAVNVN